MVILKFITSYADNRTLNSISQVLNYALVIALGNRQSILLPAAS
jgi:hypothetical protein